jgi:hypothetical protein
MTTAVDKRPAAARLVAVAAAGHLPTAPTPPQGARPRTIFFPSSMNLAVSRSAIFCSRGVSLSSLRSNRARRCAGLPLLGRGLSCPGLVSLGLRGHPLSIWMLLAPIWP